jgi:ubiquinone/menaquinone biosynthesis C-methylase UbiE
MIESAAMKARRAGVAVTFAHGDADDPPYEPSSCDVVLARHVLWAMPDPSAALRRWLELLRDGGRLVLVEGRWSTAAGLTAADCVDLIREHRTSVEIEPLSDSSLWGGPVDDERYLAVSVA